MTRLDLVHHAIGVTAQRGASDPTTSTGLAIATIARAALAADPTTDPAVVVLNLLKALHNSAAELRAELKAMDA